ncbi:hypothetical protein FPZ12_008825 [Amycolatopsis acidicola]|uniref:Integral membrane protein n=1 Tax=Amycolatopsis acidicola TaxID=2596893 RepID=A0A5N0VFW6_9PSEU|nr:hypothetical protein [Amycolatopsis acidicola]KAA9163602.1 hypothetical protein FPZ12_008825 [Amycolatopsis acidicola]
MAESVEQHPQTLTEDERAELARLRAEVARLRTTRGKRRFAWKSLAAGVLLVIGCLLAPLSLLTVWVHNQVADTDRFVATASPLIRDPAVQAAVTDRVSDTIFSQLDIEGLARDAVTALGTQGVPPVVTDTLQGLVGPLASSVRSFVHDRVADLVASPGVAQLWDQTIRTAHEQMNAVLSGNSQAVVVSGGEVRLDLAPFITAAKQQLVASGLTVAARIPDVHPTIPITDATTLTRAQRGYSLLDTMATWLPWVMLVLLALGVYLARHHRRALLGAGLGIALSMLVVAAALLITRGALVGAVPPRAAIATGDSYDIIVRFLRDGLRTVFAVGVVVAAGAFLAGPSTTAVAIRKGTKKAIGVLRFGGLRTGPVGPWVHAHLTALRVALVGVAVLVFVFLDRPSGLTVLIIALVLVFCLAVVQFLDQPASAARG